MRQHLISDLRGRIIESYGGYGNVLGTPDTLCSEAADEIERLRAENALLRAANHALAGEEWVPVGADLCVSDENPKGENAERSRGEALPARCHEMADALSPKEQKGE